MGDKSHVGMETRLCLVCGVEYETGAILLDRRLVKSLERKNCTGWGMCEEHQKLKDEGYVALVGCDESKSRVKGGTVMPEGVYRTGDIAHIKSEAFQEMFDCDVPKDGVAFCDSRVIEELKKW